MYQIVLTGPESTGKSTLAKALAQRYAVDYVSEYARAYINNLDRPYVEADLLKIAQQQQANIQAAQQSDNALLFIDTAMLVLKIWSDYKYQRCHPWILQQLIQPSIDLYVLCGTDIPWEYDTQREHPHERNTLHTIYIQELKKHQLPFIEVRGNIEERLQQVSLFLQKNIMRKL